MDFLKKSFNNFKESFRFKKSLGWAYLIQTIQIILIISFIIIYFNMVFIPKYAELAHYQNVLEQIQSDPTGANLEQIIQVKGIVQELYLIFVIGAILLSLIYLILKGLVWLKIHDKKITIKVAGSFFLFNLLVPAVSILIGWILFLIMQPVAFVILGLTTTLLLLYQSHGVINSSIDKGAVNALKRLWKIGVKKIHYFILPHIILLLVFLALTAFMIFSGQGLGYLIDFNLIIRRTMLLVYGLAFLLLYSAFFVWQKNYIYLTVKSLK